MRCYLKLGLMGGAALVALPGAALAQRASDNVTTQSSDAFGRSVGNEKSGLYTTDANVVKSIAGWDWIINCVSNGN